MYATMPSPQKKAKSLFAMFCVVDGVPFFGRGVNYPKSRKNAINEVRKTISMLESNKENADLISYYEEVIAEIAKIDRFG